jgi:hypothetical protein
VSLWWYFTTAYVVGIIYVSAMVEHLHQPLLVARVLVNSVESIFTSRQILTPAKNNAVDCECAAIRAFEWLAMVLVDSGPQLHKWPEGHLEP